MNKNAILNNRYEILERIGEGGTADIFLAHDRYLDRQVAIKILKMNFHESRKDKKKFQREAMAAAELNNPHIVGMYDVDEDEGVQYLVMEYVDGKNLKQYIKDEFPIPYAQVIDITEQLGSAVTEAHYHNIIHRDLKPQNVLIDQHNYIKITDFGISKAENKNSITQTKNVIGSIHYLSPEQIKGSAATRRSDIYSLGIILYELLTGKVPFDGDSAIAIALQHSQTPIPSVKEFDPRIPQALENVVLKATTKNPQERYASVQEMMDDLAISIDSKQANVDKFIPQSTKDLLLEDQTKVMPFSPIKKEPSKKVEKEKPKRKFKKTLIISLISLFILLLSGLMIVNAGSKTKVPNLQGTTKNEAIEAIKNAHLSVGNITYRHNRYVKKDHIVDFDPSYNKEVKRDTKVDLVVSSGIKYYTAENYIGKQFTLISKRLKSEGFTVIKKNVSSIRYQSGKILKQSVNIGKKLDPQKDVITFYVSTGAKVIKIKDLTGLTREEVIKYGDEVELNPIFKSVTGDKNTKYKVISQEPVPGESLKEGSDFVVYISNGAKKDLDDNQVKIVNVKINIPYESNNDGALVSHVELAKDDKDRSPSDDTDQTTDKDSSGAVNDDEPTEEPKDSNNLIVIYIQDHNHNLANVYKQFNINKNTEITIPFKLNKTEIGKYKVVRNGKTILNNNQIKLTAN